MERFVFLSFLCLILPSVVSAQVVDIPDPNLRAVINEELGKAPTDAITRAEMETLIDLYAYGNEITDLRGIEFAINLRWLNLNNNTISDISALRNLTNLTELSLEHNTISDVSPLANLTNLTSLSLSKNTISDISALRNLTNLTSLYIQNNTISDISALANLTNLTELSLKHNTISDISPLRNLTNLRWLYLDNNTISDISALANLTNLTWLYLDNNTISDVVPLIPLRNLKRLYIRNNNVSDFQALARLMEQGIYVYFSGNPAFQPGPKIEDEWLWLVVPVIDFDRGEDAAASGRDFLSEASGGTVTEADVAVNGAIAGTQVGDLVWTSARLDGTDGDNIDTLVHDQNLWFWGSMPLPVAYGIVPIHSKIQQETQLYIGAGPVKIWLNGRLIHGGGFYQSASNYKTAVPATLMPGENLLFIAFYRRFPYVDLDPLFPREYDWGAVFGFQEGTVYSVGAPVVDPLDVDGDGEITVIDLAIVALFYGRHLPIGVSLPADVNADGVVDILDLTAVAQAIDAANANFGQLSLVALESAWVAAAEQAAPNALSGGNLAHHNVAAALTDAKQLATNDTRLDKGVPVILETLLQLLAETKAIPETTALLPNYPNPFNPETWIPYHLANASDVEIIVFDTRGSVVRKLDLGYQQAGYYTSKVRAAYWDGRNQLGESVASGVYFYELRADHISMLRKMLILK